jgi:hypothetical protein
MAVDQDIERVFSLKTQTKAPIRQNTQRAFPLKRWTTVPADVEIICASEGQARIKDQRRKNKQKLDWILRIDDI